MKPDTVTKNEKPSPTQDGGGSILQRLVSQTPLMRLTNSDAAAEKRIDSYLGGESKKLRSKITKTIIG